MKLENLKRIRLAVSVVFFLLTGVLFLDFTGTVSPFWMNSILFLQFIPSLTKFLTLFGLAGTGFLVALLLTLFFGRIYCSTVCPLGTLQDVVSFAGRRFDKKKHHRHLKSFNPLRYGLLILTAILAVNGILMLLNLLDPFSSFGRVMANLAQPIALVVNNGIAFVLESTGIYTLNSVPLRGIALSSIVATIIILGVILWMSYKHGRLYCNTLCPVGSLLGLLSRFSLYRIAINETVCIGCNLCEQVCKGGCIDKKAKTVDFTRCVSCYNCFTVCPTDGLTFRRAFAGQTPAVPQEPDYTRREAIYNSCLLVAGAFGTTTVGTKRIISTKESTIVVVRTTPVAPPGSQGIERFTATCTACHVCVSACPSQVLIPSFLEYRVHRHDATTSGLQGGVLQL